MDRLWQDVRFGFRMVLKHPTLSIVSIVTFALGIGLTTTVFSIVNGAFFKGLPFEEGHRVAIISNTNPSRNLRSLPVSVHEFVEWREKQTAFESLGCFTVAPMNLAWGGGQPERFTSGQVSANAFEILRVNPVLGRTFREGEDRPGAEPVLIISYDIWRDRFGSSADVLGKTVRANGVARTIVGVMPNGFAFPAYEKLWVPLEINPQATKRGQGPFFQAFGRLKPGVSVAQAVAQAVAIAAQMEREYPETNRGVSATVRPYAENFLGAEIYALLYTMLGAGAGVLLIACVNVANLLLARTSLRSREVAIRIAVGAGRVRVLMQLLTEALVLAVGGGLLGFWFSGVAMKWFVTAIAVNPPPFWITFDLDHRVLLFVTGITLAASLFAGLVPGIQASRTDVSNAVKDESRASTGLRMGKFSGVLVVAEVALSCGLLIAAGLMVESIANLKNIKWPFAIENIFTARINLPRSMYPDDASCTRYYEQLLPKLRSIAGVEAATLSDGLPVAGNGTIAIQVEGQAYGRDSDYPVVREGIVTPGYFETFKTRVHHGREFTDFDKSGALPVTVVNESFARTYFAGDAMGRRIRKGRADSKFPWMTIVGVVPDMLMQGLGNTNQSPAGYYIPIAQSGVTNFVSIALRTRDDPMKVTVDVRAAVASLNPDLPIFNVMSMRDVIRRQSFAYTIFGTLFLVAGLCALFLAVAGLYAVMSFSATQRVREMGIRAALGAQGGQLVRLVIRRGVIQLVIGLALGLALALVAVNPLRIILYQVDPRDPVLILMVVAALAVSGLVASLLPAHRVARVNPVIALVAE